MMTKFPSQVLAAVAACFLCHHVLAQSSVASATRAAELHILAEELQARDLLEKQEALAAAQRLGIPMRRQLADGRVLELQRFRHGLGPEFYITNNIDAADTVSTDEVWPGGSAGLNLDGFGMTVGEWDGGAVALHPDFGSRLTQADGAVTVSNHSTHVAGTLIGSGGGHPDAIGMAHAANLDAYDWNFDTAEMALAASGGLLVSNHSYGIAAGWIYIGDPPPDQWWWIGGDQPSDVEDKNFGYYDSETQLWDQIAFDAPYYLIVKASGNDRADFGAAPGEEYTVIDQNGNFLFTSTLPRDPDCAPAGYDCLPTHSVAKNILTVGAVDDLPGGYSSFTGPSSVVMTDFSSWGPTDDGRIKPDVVGNGVLVFSTWGDNPFYALAIGTSMATPNVTGSLTLLQQHYEDLNGSGNYMRAATLKALAIHTADEAGDADGPDYEFGWGLLNTKKATEVISGVNGDHQMVEGVLSDGGTATIPFNVSQADSVIRVTLVWADPPGTPPAPVLDPPDLMLVNDLDLRVRQGGSTWSPWVLNPAAPADAATTGDNFRDNVEQVVVTGAGSGAYQVEISHKGTLLNNQDQAYSVIISVTQPPPLTSQLVIDEDFSGGLPPGWSVSTTAGASWMIRSPGSGRYANNTGGSGNFGMVDVNFSSYTVTSLLTDAHDLSTATAAVLRFNSYFQFDLWETINVDVSTNGGGSWVNVWNFSGFNPFPTVVSLDLTGTVAGHSDVRLRWRFDSFADPVGDLWQIDNVEFEVFGPGSPPGDPPGLPSNPSPADGAVGQGLDTDVTWTAGSDSDSHDVYFGTSNPLSIGDFQGNQPGTSFDPGPLANDTTYFWRIDEVNGNGTTQGPTWSFATESAPPPPPAESIHLAGLSGSAIPAPRGRWHAVAEVLVDDQDHNAEPGVTVDGTWSNGANGSGSCITGADGRCIVQKNNLKNQVSNVTFTVDNLSKTGMNYVPGDSEASSSVVINKNDVDQTPTAVDDDYSTGVDTVLSANVMDNDNQGDGPATINTNTLPTDGVLNLNLDGSFDYTPDSGFEGQDSFTYSIIDADGDISNTASVTITVADAPPPPPPGAPTLNTRPYKVRGFQHVELTWENLTGAQVDISRDGLPLPDSPVSNTGSYVDNIGVKGGGVTYDYEVCEAGTNTCATASASF